MDPPFDDDDGESEDEFPISGDDVFNMVAAAPRSVREGFYERIRYLLEDLGEPDFMGGPPLVTELKGFEGPYLAPVFVVPFTTPGLLMFQIARDKPLRIHLVSVVWVDPEANLE